MCISRDYILRFHSSLTAQNRLHYLFKVVALIIIGVIVFGCKEYRPASNTMEHKLAHGHIESKVNELWVGGTLLRIPPNIEYNPITSGKIISGKADQVYFGLRYPQFELSQILNQVPILVGKGYEDPDTWDKYLTAKNWMKIIKREDIGLVEYRQDVNYTGHGYITYTPIDEAIKTLKGGLILY